MKKSFFQPETFAFFLLNSCTIISYNTVFQWAVLEFAPSDYGPSIMSVCTDDVTEVRGKKDEKILL